MNILHTITVICAYCKKTIETKDGEGISGTSHGICPICMGNVSQMIHKETHARKSLWIWKTQSHKH